MRVLRADPAGEGGHLAGAADAVLGAAVAAEPCVLKKRMAKRHGAKRGILMVLVHLQICTRCTLAQE